jgi:hypothetical protein
VIADDPAVYLADFGEPAIAGGVTVRVIFDQPGQDLMSGRLANNQYEMLYVSSTLPGLLYGAQISIRGDAFKVINTNALDDGVMSRAVLEEA